MRALRGYPARVHVRHVIVLACILIVSAACLPSQPTNPDAAFERETGAKLDGQIVLVTDKLAYDLSKPYLVYWIINRKSQPLYFSDQSLGIRAYKLGPDAATWSRLDLASKVLNPKPLAIEPRTVADHNAFPLDFASIPSGGMVRLVVIGWTDPKNPDGSKVAAYIDVEIPPKQQ